MTVIRRDPPNNRERVVRAQPRYLGLLTPEPQPSRPNDDPIGTQVIVKDGGAYGPRGPQGIPGPQGASLEYVRSVPAATWVIEHNFGHRVHVSLLDPYGVFFLSEVEQHPPYNTVSVSFPSPTTGSAFIS